MASTISVGSTTVGLIVRGKKNDAHKPGVMEQHADCILPGGAPIGFFGEGGDASSGSSGRASSGSSWANGPSISLNSTGINMKGLVADYATMQKIRPFYVDAALAKKYKVISTILLLDVSTAEASRFKQYWQDLKLKPGSFNLLGGNCSTHASEAFVFAKIVAGGIPGLDTPDNLYRQLKAKAAGKKKNYSGYVGFNKLSAGRYDAVVL